MKRLTMTINQFMNATKINYLKAITLSSEHLASLQQANTADPANIEIGNLLTRFVPIDAELQAAYIVWKSRGGQQQGSTLGIKQLMTLMKAKLDAWIYTITGIYAVTTEAYKTLFPNGRDPFYQGKRESRLKAVETLANTMADYALLAAVKIEVDNYFGLLNNATGKQTGAKKGKKDGSVEVEAARKKTMNIMFSNAGMLIYLYPDKPLVVSNFFNVELLQEHLQNIFSGTIEHDQFSNVLTHTFNTTDTIDVSSLTDANIRIFLSDSATAFSGSMQEVLGNQKKTLKISDFNVDVSTHRYLIILNLSGAMDAKYKVKI